MVPTWLPLMLVGIVLSVIVAIFEYQRRTVSAALCGGLASLLFVTVGIVCRMETGDRRYSLIVIGGLLLCAAGFVMLGLGGGGHRGGALAGGLGMGVFLMGHAAYIAALIYRGYIAFVIALPLALALGAMLAVYVLRRPGAPKKHRGFIVFYLLLSVLIFCWSVALLILNLPDSTYHLFTLGALGLLVFDIDLMFRLFGKGVWLAARAAAFIAYATGQLLIALSILFA